MITFQKDSHIYRSGDIKYISVTSLINNYKNQFDSGFWSTYKALERLIGKEDFKEMRRHRDFKSPSFIEWACSFVDHNDLLKTITIIQKEWDDERDTAAEKGSYYHIVKEKQAYNDGYTINPFSGKKVHTAVGKPPPGKKESTVMDLWDLKDGYYPELMLWNHAYRIAGTADKVFIETIENRRFVDIDDFKTNKEIKKTNSYEKMKTPLGRLDDCNYNHYRLQICTYAWMLEENGYKIRNVSFTHFNEQYKLSYGHTRKYIIEMLNHHKITQDGSLSRH